MNLNLILQYILPKKFLAQLFANLANSTNVIIKNMIIKTYCKLYNIDKLAMEEMLETDPLKYPTFNEFFIRILKPGMRPIAQGDSVIASPVDGAVLQTGKIESNTLVVAKNKGFTLQELLADSDKAQEFIDGSLAIVYLAPYNYHRVHMPVRGRLRSILYIPGDFFSVNPKVINNIPNVFAKNERVVMYFDTELGLMCLIMVGAMIVGSIETIWTGVIDHGSVSKAWDYSTANLDVDKGAEIGNFKLGSTVILLFANDRIQWDGNMQQGSVIKMGQSLGGCKE